MKAHWTGPADDNQRSLLIPDENETNQPPKPIRISSPPRSLTLHNTKAAPLARQQWRRGSGSDEATRTRRRQRSAPRKAVCSPAPRMDAGGRGELARHAPGGAPDHHAWPGGRHGRLHRLARGTNPLNLPLLKSDESSFFKI
jgi:hypothetical protein